MKALKNMLPAPCCTLNISGREQEKFLKMSKALGNPLRFDILKYLLTHPGCINSDLVNFLPIAQATVSQHIKVLEEAGWIEVSADGRATSLCLNEKNIAWYKVKIGEIL